VPEFLLSVHGALGQEPPSPEVMAQMFADVAAFNERLQSHGAWVFAGGLQGPDDAAVVEVRGGETVVTDGRFAGGDVFLGGFWVIEAPDKEAAVELAARGSAACRAPVEVRPFQVEPEA
jgi:hypothetical protein